VEAAVEIAAARKITKYTALESCYLFQPIAMETLDQLTYQHALLLADSVKRISDVLARFKKAAFFFSGCPC